MSAWWPLTTPIGRRPTQWARATARYASRGVGFGFRHGVRLLFAADEAVDAAVSARGGDARAARPGRQRPGSSSNLLACAGLSRPDSRAAV